VAVAVDIPPQIGKYEVIHDAYLHVEKEKDSIEPYPNKEIGVKQPIK
jgi:hypothetical protein